MGPRLFVLSTRNKTHFSRMQLLFYLYSSIWTLDPKYQNNPLFVGNISFLLKISKPKIANIYFRFNKPPPARWQTSGPCKDSIKVLNDSFIVEKTWAAIWFECGHRKLILMWNVNVIMPRRQCGYDTHANLRYLRHIQVNARIQRELFREGYALYCKRETR